MVKYSISFAHPSSVRSIAPLCNSTVFLPVGVHEGEFQLQSAFEVEASDESISPPQMFSIKQESPPPQEPSCQQSFFCDKTASVVAINLKHEPIEVAVEFQPSVGVRDFTEDKLLETDDASSLAASGVWSERPQETEPLKLASTKRAKGLFLLPIKKRRRRPEPPRLEPMKLTSILQPLLTNRLPN